MKAILKDDKKDIREWLHVPEHVWNYLDAIHVKKGKIQLNEALEDRNLNTGMRIKIKNYSANPKSGLTVALFLQLYIYN